MAFVIPNLALLLWIIVTVILFNRVRPATAAAISLLGAGLVLPVGFGPDFPGLPQLSRHRIAALTSLVMIIALRPKVLNNLRRHPRMLLLAVVTVLSPMIGAMTNRDAYLHLHRMNLHDGFTISEIQFMDVALPFLLGLMLVRGRRDVRMMLVLIVSSGLIYSMLVLYEVRMAPTLHREIYGYLPHGSWNQTKRFGGWRPMVFMPHGIALARYLALVVLAAGILHRLRRPVFGLNPALVTLYLAVVLLLAKSLGAIIFAIALLPLVMNLSAKKLGTVTIVLCVVIFSYPITRLVGLFPTDTLISMAETIDPVRAESLAFRFYNEDLLLDHALKKPLFGWGGWARNRVYDPVTQEELTTATDGYWIIIFGYQGIVGFVCAFGILLFPALLVARRIHRVRGEAPRLELIGLAILAVVNAADLLPNGMPMSFMFFATGGLAGALPGVIREQSASQVQRKRRAGAPPPTTNPAAITGDGSEPAGLASLLGPSAGPRDV